MHIGLYFGSFNPIHKGHLAVAEGMYRQSLFSAIWFVVSPNSPFKDCLHLLDEHKRLELVKVAINGLSYCFTSDIEFEMERPSYTYLTLRKLKQIHPSYTFSIIMGADNLSSIDKWKNYEEIIQNHSIYVYPRTGIEPQKDPKNIFYIHLPLVNISSSQIRERLKKGKTVKEFVPKEVIDMIEKEKFYQ